MNRLPSDLPARLAALGALIAAIGAHAWGQARWIQRDLDSAWGICCDYTFHLRDLARERATGALGWADLAEAHYPGGMTWLGLVAQPWAGAGPDLTFWTQWWQMALCQVAMYVLVSRLGGRIAGVVAAGSLPLAPGAAYTMRTWAPYVPQTLFLLGALVCLIESRSLSRPHWALGFAALAAAGAFVSPMLTDNLIFVATAGAAAAGAGLRGMLLRRGPRGAALWSRLWVLVMVVAVAGAVTWVQWRVYSGRKDSLYLFPYMFREMGLDLQALGGVWAEWRPLPGHETAATSQVAITAGPDAWSAYARRLYAKELTAFHAIPLLIGGALYTWRGRGRAELLTGAILPLVVVSAVGKKLFYYAYLALPFAPAIAALGLCGRWPNEPGWGRWVRGGLGVALLGLGAWQWTIRSFPQEFPAQSTRAWEGPLFDEALYFQYHDEIQLAPTTDPPPTPAADLVAARLPDTCPEPLLVRALALEGDPAQVEIAAMAANPCMSISVWPEQLTDPVGALIVRSPVGCAIPPAARWRSEIRDVEAAGWTRIAAERRGRSCLMLYGDPSLGWAEAPEGAAPGSPGD